MALVHTFEGQAPDCGTDLRGIAAELPVDEDLGGGIPEVGEREPERVGGVDAQRLERSLEGDRRGRVIGGETHLARPRERTEFHEVPRLAVAGIRQ